MNFSVGDDITLFTVMIASATLIARSLFHWRGVGARAAAKDASTAALDRAQGRELARLAEGLEGSNDQFRAHELDCVEFRATTTAALKSIVATMEKNERRLGNIEAQFRLYATGANDRFYEVRHD